MGDRPTLDRTHVASLFTAQSMSRHTHRRLAEPRRFVRAGQTEASQPVRLATPEPAVPDGPTPPPGAALAGATIPAAALPMAIVQAPLTAERVLLDEPNGLPGGQPNGLPGGQPNGLPGGQPNGLPGGGCTPAQLRRFIKSRAYLPVHEIRRRFGIESADDDVTGFSVDNGRVFVGLPLREGRILGDLVRAGEVGYELQLDPEAPIIVGVYPMRPVTRQ
jgi:hypothetical protein